MQDDSEYTFISPDPTIVRARPPLGGSVSGDRERVIPTPPGEGARERRTRVLRKSLWVAAAAVGLVLLVLFSVGHGHDGR
jgi:hypothetical protein